MGGTTGVVAAAARGECRGGPAAGAGAGLGLSGLAGPVAGAAVSLRGLPPKVASAEPVVTLATSVRCRERPVALFLASCWYSSTQASTNSVVCCLSWWRWKPNTFVTPALSV